MYTNQSRHETVLLCGFLKLLISWCQQYFQLKKKGENSLKMASEWCGLYHLTDTQTLQKGWWAANEFQFAQHSKHLRFDELILGKKLSHKTLVGPLH